MSSHELPNPRDYTVDPISAEEIAIAAAALRKGELVVFPTETFYAIGADPKQANALAAIARAKGRDQEKTIALIAADAFSAFGVARQIPANARWLAEAFWPGPLTVVLPARAGLNEALLGPNGGIGVRVSPHPVARSLAREVGGLLTATSANLSGEPPARTLTQARRSLGAQISVYVEGGALGSDAPSTVVEFDEDGGWRILRAGAIDCETLTAALRNPR